MPRPKQDPPLDTMVRVRMTTPDLERIRSRAEAAGMSVSDWMRYRLAGWDDGDGVELKPTKKPTPRRGSGRRRPFTEADPAMVAQLARIGNNLNQIAKWCNEHKRAAEAVAVIAHLAAIEAQLEILLPTAPLQAPHRESQPDAHQIPAP